MSDRHDKCGDIAFSSRVRLARNLKNIPFPERLSDHLASDVASRISKATKALMKDETWRDLELSSIDPLHRQALVERHLVSREMIGGRHDARLLIRDDEKLGVLVNEEDHMRIQALRPGFDLEDAYVDASELARRLEGELDIALDPLYGYLTCCPTNVGTGMRASVMVHLPALARANLIPKLLQTLSRSGFTLRGYSGEGSSAEGDLFQISNQVTLGRSERDILADLSEITAQVIDSEKRSRQAFYDADPLAYEDRVARAYGILTNAVTISHEEATTLLSTLREGVERGLRSIPAVETLNALQLIIGPANVAWRENLEPDFRGADAIRADLIRKQLNDEINDDNEKDKHKNEANDNDVNRD